MRSPRSRRASPARAVLRDGWRIGDPHSANSMKNPWLKKNPLHEHVVERRRYHVGDHPRPRGHRGKASVGRDDDGRGAPDASVLVRRLFGAAAAQTEEVALTDCARTSRTGRTASGTTVPHNRCRLGLGHASGRLRELQRNAVGTSSLRTRHAVCFRCRDDLAFLRRSTSARCTRGTSTARRGLARPGRHFRGRRHFPLGRRCRRPPSGVLERARPSRHARLCRDRQLDRLRPQGGLARAAAASADSSSCRERHRRSSAAPRSASAR